MVEIASRSHFVPQGYLKGWSADRKQVWMYRLLVSSDSVPNWRERSIRGIAFHQHLYTRIAARAETDEVERWLNEEFETPAQEALDRVRRSMRLVPSHWKALSRFAAAQHVRTPARFLEMMRRWNRDLKHTVEETLRSSVAELERARQNGIAITSRKSNDHEHFPSRVSVRKLESGGGEVGLELVAGRGLWLFTIRHLLTSTVRALENHRWTILNAPDDMEWMTSDDPVIPLNYYARGRYDFKGGWGNKGTEILLPLSPRHMLYTQVGTRNRLQGAVDPGLAMQLQRFVAEHAHRALFAVRSTPQASSLRPRTVSRDQYLEEAHQWNDWHEEQTRAELELYSRRE